MLSCRDATRLISRSLDEPIGRRKRWALRLHLLFCYWCRRFATQARALHRGLRPGGRLHQKLMDHEEPCLDPEAAQHMEERLQQALAKRNDEGDRC